MAEPFELRTVQGFATLFAGRADAWFDSIKTRAVRRPVGLEHFRRHLTGDMEIGTYPVLDDSACRWSCIDIDTDDIGQAIDVGQVWRYFSVTPWLEVSRSKGFHVWAFCQSWCPATVVRDAGLYVAQIAGLPDGTEVNPKGDAPWRTATGLINTVRLPYSGRAAPGRMVCLAPDLSALSLSAFVEGAMATRASTSQLRQPAQLWQAQAKAKAYRVESAIEQVGAYVGPSASQQEAAQILRGERLVSPGERDNQFFTMAKMLHGLGTDQATALALIERVYFNQVTDTTGFELEQALAKVRRVYN